MARQLTIGDMTFNTATSARDFIRTFMNNAEVDTPLTNDDERFVLALLGRHPHSTEKIGSGIEYFVVRINRFVGRANRGLWIKRTDGSEIDFSWVECLKPSTHEYRVKNAMRSAIQDDVFEFKRITFNGRSTVDCKITGLPVAFADADVHHVPSFVELVERFTGRDYAGIEVDAGKCEAQIGDRLVDDAYRDKWVEYHKQTAGLFIVDRAAHQKLGKVTGLTSINLSEDSETF